MENVQRGRSSRGLAVMAAAGVVALSGCAGLVAGSAESAGPARSAASAGTEYRCWGEQVPQSALESGPTADTLEAAEALDGTEVPEIDPAEWTVLWDSAQKVVLIRELDEPEDLGAGDVRTHELLAVEWVDAVNLDPSPAWVLSRLSTCALATEAGESASVTLDPATPPDPASSELHLLVTEMACNSGQVAEGRVRVVELAQDEEAVGVEIAVDPREGGADCQSNPPTPFVVELDAPLGDRAVYDTSVLPPRELTMPPESD